MKRLWLGVAILLILLLAGIGSTVFMARFHSALTRDLEKACQAVTQGDWTAALELADRAEYRWEKGKRTAAAFADHEPLEQVDDVFAQLRLYGKLRLAADYAAACTHLAEIARALGESQSLFWWNLL